MNTSRQVKSCFIKCVEVMLVCCCVVVAVYLLTDFAFVFFVFFKMYLLFCLLVCSCDVAIVVVSTAVLLFRY